ncbi:MAG: MTH938/NDUFAF3 family protein [Kiritimatiellia bacterium]
MKIEHYSFGEITIDGRKYDSDILIYPDGRIDDSWWRKEGHVLDMEDIRELLESDPREIIAGTGASGMMRPEGDLEERLKASGIEFTAVPTEEAVRKINGLTGQEGVAACLHLTC